MTEYEIKHLEYMRSMTESLQGILVCLGNQGSVGGPLGSLQNELNLQNINQNLKIIAETQLRNGSIGFPLTQIANKLK